MSDPIYMILDIRWVEGYQGDHWEEEIDHDLGYFTTRAAAQDCVDELNAENQKSYQRYVEFETQEHEAKLQAVRHHNETCEFLIAHGREPIGRVQAEPTLHVMDFERWLKSRYVHKYGVIEVKRNGGDHD